MIKNIFKALKDYAGSFRLMSQLGLWKYFMVPMAISILFAVTIGFTAYGLSDNLAGPLTKLWIWETGADAFFAFAEVLSAIIIIILGLLVYKHFVMALSAPFMSPVSEKIEKHLYPEVYDASNYRDTSNASQLSRGIRINIRNLFYELLLTIPLLLLSLIPVIGILFWVIGFLVQSYYAGFGNMDYTLERHFKYRASVDFVKNHRGCAIGNGIVFNAMLLIPIIGIILVLPISVTAASKTTLELLRGQKLLADQAT
ncbi:coproporphyrinogen III oxidase [Nonlabens sp. YIK11]|uniref:EI24 domain-containing protein n=1 Tax=Nonlabens sp. YIK11 TaxID=1453349 RepID=UPI0006DD30E4|nr:EI24 domain-containing protein [Nonlabens sp. YIK11]KQC32156.1 coproporphyrinogen III oxidase [Nonlabens sp. YIK11]